MIHTTWMLIMRKAMIAGAGLSVQNVIVGRNTVGSKSNMRKFQSPEARGSIMTKQVRRLDMSVNFPIVGTKLPIQIKKDVRLLNLPAIVLLTLIIWQAWRASRARHGPFGGFRGMN